MTATETTHRFVGLGPNAEVLVPAIVDAPKSVRKANDQAVEMLARWREAGAEVWAKRDEITAAVADDRANAAAAVAGASPAPPATSEAAARQACAIAERAYEAVSDALVNAQKILLVEILQARDEWLPKARQNAETALDRALEAVDQLADAIEQLEAERLLVAGLEAVPENGSIAGVRMGASERDLQYRREQRAHAIETARSRAFRGVGDAASLPTDELLAALVARLGHPPEGEPGRAAW